MEISSSQSVHKFKSERLDRSPKVLLWVSMVSMSMLFAGLTSAYVVRQAEGNWDAFNIPMAFLISTIIIVASSGTLHWALKAIRKDDLKTTKTFLIITLGLGFAFVFSQFLGWSELVENGVYFVNKKTPSGSFFYVLTGLHLAHIVGGLLYLMIISAKSILNKYNSSNYLGIQLCSIYWHFLDVLWLYLYAFLWFIR
ncbi:MAG: hypothetical protein HKN22_01440 [Bacteroidia bacterium]|nr:hypothetical protein [Bacteroidia bacterium]